MKKIIIAVLAFTLAAPVATFATPVESATISSAARAYVCTVTAFKKTNVSVAAAHNCRVERDSNGLYICIRGEWQSVSRTATRILLEFT